MDDRFGALTFVRIYSGKLNKGDTILNSFTGKTERVGRMVEMQADDRNNLTGAQTGDIIASLVWRTCQTGHTLCDPESSNAWANGFPNSSNLYRCISKDKGGSEKNGIANQ